MSLGERIKKRRTALGLQSQFVAKKVGVSLSTYSDWENGRQIRGEIYFVKLAEVLSMSLSELFTGKTRIESEKQLQAIESAVNILRQNL